LENPIAGTSGMEKEATQIAIVGAGIFVRTQYIPRLAEISELFTLKAIWSRSEVLTIFCSFYYAFFLEYYD
jgi:hypothetical protein